MWQCGMSADSCSIGQSQLTGVVCSRSYTEYEDQGRADRTAPVCIGEEYKKHRKGGMLVDEKEVFEICNQVDSLIAAELTESIVIGTSYDMLEAHHGILPISRNCFYRKRRIVQRIIKQRVGRIVEEPNGQLRMVW